MTCIDIYIVNVIIFTLLKWDHQQVLLEYIYSILTKGDLSMKYVHVTNKIY